jgi:hypothetical protein
MNNFAPVLICTLNRYEHFKRCIESLATCTHADKTDLYIAIDYPSKDSQFEGYDLINECLHNITGFNSLIILEREINYGSEKNFLKAKKTIYEKYDRIIISEDDNVFAPNFLDYMNKGLDEFKDMSHVSTICGYKFPFEVPGDFPYNYFYSKGFSGWGVGLWREKYLQQRWNDNSIEEINRFLHRPLKAFSLISYQYGLLSGLMNIVKTGKFTGDRMYCFSNMINGKYSIFPTVSKVRNTGHDGSGVNSTKMEGSKNIFIDQSIDSDSKFDYTFHCEFENMVIDNAFKKHIKSYNHLRAHHKVLQLFKYFKFVIGY